MIQLDAEELLPDAYCIHIVFCNLESCFGAHHQKVIGALGPNSDHRTLYGLDHMSCRCQSQV